MSIKKITTAAALGVALIGSTMLAPAPANASHQYGHAIAGGIIGGIIGGAIVRGQQRRYNPPPPVYVAPTPYYGSLPGQHYNICISKYKSYHPPSNTFQPYNGPRRQCRTVYWGY